VEFFFSNPVESGTALAFEDFIPEPLEGSETDAGGETLSNLGKETHRDPDEEGGTRKNHGSSDETHDRHRFSGG
jgi:hypothetical protein